MFIGEFPPLPPDLIKALHQQRQTLHSRVINYAWEKVAEGAASFFED